MALSEKDIDAKINTVIQGDYESESVKVEKGKVWVGKLEVSSTTCEKSELVSEDEDSVSVKKTKRGFAAKVVATALFPPAALLTVKSGYNDLHSYGKLIKLSWRNGKESLIFVNKSIAQKIENIFF